MPITRAGCQASQQQRQTGSVVQCSARLGSLYSTTPLRSELDMNLWPAFFASLERAECGDTGDISYTVDKLRMSTGIIL